MRDEYKNNNPQTEPQTIDTPCTSVFLHDEDCEYERKREKKGSECGIFTFTEDLKSAIIYTVLLQLVSIRRDEAKETMRIYRNKPFKLLVDKV